MEYYQEFLKKLQSSIKSDQQTSLKNFIDSELTEMYQEILANQQRKNESLIMPSQLPETLKKLNNQTLKKNLTLNFYFSHTYVLNLVERVLESNYPGKRKSGESMVRVIIRNLL